MKTLKNEKVFVYGTLKSGNKQRGLDRIEEGNVLIGEARTMDQTYSLYDLGMYPAAGLSGEYYIEGEVWEVTPETFKQLDAIEGYPHYYNRKQVDTTAGKAWMYYIPNIDNSWDVEDKKITSPTKNTVSWNW